MVVSKLYNIEPETNTDLCSVAHNCQGHETENGNELIQCVIRWVFGGEEVFVTGCFNSWKKLQEYRLFKCGHDHVIVVELTRDIHFYKFIVDGEWKYSTEHPINSDREGFVNNYIDLRRYQKPEFSKCGGSNDSNCKFYQNLPNEFPADVPTVPIILGKSKCPLESANSTHTPFHCISNHIYYDSHIQGIFGTQFVTFCLTKRWYNKKFLHRNRFLHRYTTILYTSYRTLNEFHPMIVSRNENSPSQSSHEEGERQPRNSHLSERLFTITEVFASIFT